MNKNVFVFCEQRDGEIQKVAFELVGKARELADALGQEVVAVLAGSNIEGKAASLIAHGADKVIVADDPMLAEYSTKPYTEVMEKVIADYAPEVVLFGASSIGRDLAPSVSATVHTGLTADCKSRPRSPSWVRTSLLRTTASPSPTPRPAPWSTWSTSSTSITSSCA